MFLQILVQTTKQQKHFRLYTQEYISEYKRLTARNKSVYIVLKLIFSNSLSNKNIIFAQKYNLKFPRSDSEPPAIIENITNFEAHKDAAYIKNVETKKTIDYIDVSYSIYNLHNRMVRVNSGIFMAL
ncbi:hypothetical protein CDIK_1303 [Cucumispora dikerogammari]|nr:hypothetical protein CDIK_1303 [Cucumispora dikerogammari]